MNIASAEIDESIASPKFGKMRITSSSMTVEAWIPSEIEAISPLVDWLMHLIKRFRGAAGNEPAVELALRGALNNEVPHGNAMDTHKLVEVCLLRRAERSLADRQGSRKRLNQVSATSGMAEKEENCMKLVPVFVVAAVNCGLFQGYKGLRL